MAVSHSVRWIAAAQAIRFASQLLSVAVLARLLPAEAYGLIAMAMTVTNLGFLFRDLGTMTAILQRRALSDTLTCTLYWFNLAMALALGLLLAALAVPLAALYHEPSLAPVLAALALAFPLSGLAAVQQALLEREAQFRLLARVEAVSALGGVAAAVLLASQGGQVWSLVAQMLVGTGLTALQVLRVVPWRPRRLFAWRALREVAGFSGYFSLFQLVSYLQRNADSVIIGRVFGSAALGVYAMAYKVMLFPMQHITGIASRALAPVMRRCQDQPERMAALYLRATATVAMLAAPLMAGLHALREPFVLLAFGPRWMGAAALLKWLAAVGLIQALSAVPASVFLALGKSRLMLGLGLFGAAVQLAGFALALPWGIEGFAASYCVANLLTLLTMTWHVLRCLPLRPVTLLAEAGKPLLAAAVMLAAVTALQAALPGHGLAGAAAFWLCVLAGALTYAVTLAALLRRPPGSWRALFAVPGAGR